MPTQQKGNSMEGIFVVLGAFALIIFSFWCEAMQQKEYRQRTRESFESLKTTLSSTEAAFARAGCTDEKTLESLLTARYYHDWVQKELDRAKAAGEDRCFWTDGTNFRGILSASTKGMHAANKARLQLSALTGVACDEGACAK